MIVARVQNLMVALVVLLVPSQGLAQSAFELDKAINAPDWLQIRGEARVRYETLDGQFRAAGSGGDQALAFRTLVLVEANLAPLNMPALTFGLEGQDSRMELDDQGTPTSNGLVNPLDVLQAYARLDLKDTLGQKTISLTLGRQTLDVGSRRVLERVEMANVISAYTGAYLRTANARGDEWHVVHVSPVGRLPNIRAALAENKAVSDEEEWGRRFWGVHHRRKDALGKVLPDVWAEGFVYRLIERDTSDVQTPNRDYWQPGFRVFRAPKAGQSDFEVEASWRTGNRRATSLATDRRDLNVRASTLHAHWGWNFKSQWNWRAAIDYDYASGDKSPSDGNFEQYERLFGGRRTDLGNTGIYGPLTPTNLHAPGARIEFAPNRELDMRIAYKAAWLDSVTDIWIDGRLRDPTGKSGRFIGHAWDSRARYWLIPNNLRGEIGVSVLFPGEFARKARGAPGQAQTLFGYAQLTTTF